MSFSIGQALVDMDGATLARFDFVEMVVGHCFHFVTVFQSAAACWACSAYVREVAVACVAVGA